MQRRITIDGELLGTIWMPAATAWKPVTGTLTDRGRIDGETVRDLLCRLTNDGDFQECRFTPNTVLVVEWERRTGNYRETRERVTPLSDLPAFAEFCTEELPDYGEY